MKITRAVKEATTIVALGVLLLSLLMQGVYLLVVLLSPALTWHYSFVLGNLLMGTAVILNFFLMALSINGAVEGDPELAQKRVRFNHTLRSLMMVAFLVLAFLLPNVFNIVATAVPVTFPQIAVIVYNVFHRKGQSSDTDNPDAEEVTGTGE